MLSEHKSNAGLDRLRKQIEMIGIGSKLTSRNREIGTENDQHFINELDKIGLQLINIRGTWIGRLIVLLEQNYLDRVYYY
jgi:hypothetical protein